MSDDVKKSAAISSSLAAGLAAWWIKNKGGKPPKAGGAVSARRPLVFGDAPSQEARMYGGGRFGYNKFPGRR